MRKIAVKLAQSVIAAALCVLIPSTALASDNGYKITWDGGSIPAVKEGATLRIYMDGKQIHLLEDKKDLATIDASSVTEISYGQDVHRRVGTAIGLAVFSLGLGAIMLLSKSKKHFIGLTWINGDAKGGFVMQCDKNDYRGILMGLEGMTGKKAIDSDAMNVKN